MPDTGWTEVVALVAVSVILALATPAGVFGVMLLLPFQVSIIRAGGAASGCAE